MLTGDRSSRELSTPTVYANEVDVWHSSVNFALDFLINHPGQEGDDFAVRVFLSPQTAKVLSKMLLDSVDGYEVRFGAMALMEQLETVDSDEGDDDQ